MRAVNLSLILPLLLLTACAKPPAPVVAEAPPALQATYPRPTPTPVLLTNQPVKNLFFAHDVDTLLPGQIRLLPYLTRWAAHNGVTVVVTGYADTTGPEDLNVALSLRRAEAVAAKIGCVPVAGGETDMFGEDGYNRRVVITGTTKE